MTPYSWVIYIVLCTGGGYRQKVNMGTVRDDIDRDSRIEDMVINRAKNEGLGEIEFTGDWRWNALTLKKEFVLARQISNISPLTYYQFEANLRIRE